MRSLVIALILLVSTTSAASEGDKYESIQSKINVALESGDMNHPNWDEAAQLLNPLLDADEPEALYYSSFFYAYGVGGFPSDVDTAMNNELKAANFGSVSAMLAQARRYEYGVSKSIDFRESLAWYIKAGEAGSRTAASRLRDAYKNGELGLEEDEKLALRWEEIAGECRKP